MVFPDYSGGANVYLRSLLEIIPKGQTFIFEACEKLLLSRSDNYFGLGLV